MLRNFAFVILLAFMVQGCKKATTAVSIPNNGSITMGLAGQSTRTFSMNLMSDSLFTPGCPGVFSDSCQFPAGSGYYLLIGEFQAPGYSNNNRCFLYMGVAGIFKKAAVDSILYLFASDTGAINYASYNGVMPAIGVQIQYTDAGGQVWDTKTGNNSGSLFRITSTGALKSINATADKTSYYTTVNGTFNCNAFNNAGDSAVLSGGFSNVTLLLN